MAAKAPIVSTSIGAEGLPVIHGRNLYLADTPEAFAQHCLELLDSETARREIAQTAYEMVSARFSWENAARVFESILRDETPALSRP
jgi:glycosyltransferase involved in cell wall biosynthesis